MATEKRYRPSVTLAELQAIIAALDPAENSALIKKLKLLEFKVTNGMTQESYAPVTKDGRSLLPEEKREAAYIEWQTSPETCTEATMKLADLHRYTHDLMTPPEKDAYEKSQFDI